jgi:hypothetical protein
MRKINICWPKDLNIGFNFGVLDRILFRFFCLSVLSYITSGLKGMTNVSLRLVILPIEFLPRPKVGLKGNAGRLLSRMLGPNRGRGVETRGWRKFYPEEDLYVSYTIAQVHHETRGKFGGKCGPLRRNENVFTQNISPEPEYRGPLRRFGPILRDNTKMNERGIG